MAAEKGKQKKRPNKKRPEEPSPQNRRLTKRQAIYLAEQTGMPVEEIAELKLGEVREKLEWHLDPLLLFYRRVCGRVVRRDPITGELHPVPYATVHVEDTDCNVLFYAPEGYGYIWIYPGVCSREEIATVQTDECGNFCVWIPRWDIDRLLRWRRERVCFPVFEPPRIIDILEDLFPIPEVPRPPIPLPDPPPDFSEVEIRREVEARLGTQVANRLASLAPDRVFGAFKGAFDAALGEPAPPDALPSPPLPDPEQLPIVHREEKRFESIDLRNPLGPFKVCVDIFIPEWQYFFDVPDITFRVTQTQSGSEVTIYQEGFFDVRWDETSIPYITLEAGPNAEAVEICDEDPGIVCEDEPAILNISEMPLDPVLPPSTPRGYHDNTAGDDTFGYGLRVNQPSPDGVAKPTPGPAAGTAHAPYADRLNLYGCFHIEGSTHYRVMATFESGAQKPIKDVTFPVLTTGFALDYQTPDADGWYQIRNDLISSYEHLILPWPTQQSRFADGTYEIVLQVGSGPAGGITVDSESDPYTFEVDNSRPTAIFHQIRWWHDHPADGPGSAIVLANICPVIERDPAKDVIVEITWSASAAHLRSATAGFRGCGGGHPSAQGADSNRKWWWQTPGDTTTSVKVARWKISTSLPVGCYTAALDAVSRAYNPAVPGASTSADWYVLEDRREVHPRKAISVVNV